MASSDTGFRILFVCTGNTCRSPMAAAALKSNLGSEHGRIVVTSAGIAAWEGQPATTPSVEAAAADGVDLGEHASRRVTPEMLREADLVLVMEQVHANAVLVLGADPRRTHVLSEWPAPGEPGLEISDPYGASPEAYEECWRRIRRHIRRAVPHILEAARTRSA